MKTFSIKSESGKTYLDTFAEGVITRTEVTDESLKEQVKQLKSEGYKFISEKTFKTEEVDDNTIRYLKNKFLLLDVDEHYIDIEKKDASKYEAFLKDLGYTQV